MCLVCKSILSGGKLLLMPPALAKDCCFLGESADIILYLEGDLGFQLLYICSKMFLHANLVDRSV